VAPPLPGGLCASSWILESGSVETEGDGDQVREDFTNGGRGHPPKHLKFFLLVFSKIKEELNKANKKTTSIQEEWAPINISLYSFFCINL